MIKNDQSSEAANRRLAEMLNVESPPGKLKRSIYLAHLQFLLIQLFTYNLRHRGAYKRYTIAKSMGTT
jgi:hypothetical protein